MISIDFKFPPPPSPTTTTLNFARTDPVACEQPTCAVCVQYVTGFLAWPLQPCHTKGQRRLFFLSFSKEQLLSITLQQLVGFFFN